MDENLTTVPEGEVERSIVFADVCQSTRLYERFGDHEAYDLVLHALTLMEKQTKKHGGRVVKTIGDELFCCFNQPERAIMAVCDMQHAVSSDPKLMAAKLSIRIGLHHGAVIEQLGDVFGDAVNVSARAAGLASAEEIITTAETIEAVPDLDPTMVRSIARIRVKGKAEKIEFFEVLWQDDPTEITSQINILDMKNETLVSFLRLEYQGTHLDLSRVRPLLLMGRSKECDLQVADQCVSREHAMLRFRDGKFIFIDQSTNGSYVTIKDEKNLFVHRDEIWLLGEGCISLGQEITEGSDSLIYFSVS